MEKKKNNKKDVGRDSKKEPKKGVKTDPKKVTKKVVPKVKKEKPEIITGDFVEDITFSFAQTPHQERQKGVKRELKHQCKKHGLLFKITSIILALISVYFLIGGIELITLGGSWYYLILSIGLLVTAFYLWRQDGFFYLIYALILVCTGIWSLWEEGLRWWLLVSRLWLFFVIGLILCIPAYYRSISKAKGMIFIVISLIFIAIIGIASLFVSSDTIKGTINNPVVAKLNPDQVAGRDWPAFGGTNAGLHYSSLDQITPQNIKHLKEIWRIRTGDMPTTADGSGLTNENTPLKVNGKLYTCTSHGWVLAL